jgi:hypothetical protein
MSIALGHGVIAATMDTASPAATATAPIIVTLRARGDKLSPFHVGPFCSVDRFGGFIRLPRLSSAGAMLTVRLQCGRATWFAKKSARRESMTRLTAGELIEQMVEHAVQDVESVAHTAW